MADKVTPGPLQDDARIREATCIHTKKIYDSCQSKDCIEDLRVFPTVQSQAILERAVSVKAVRAELLFTYLDVNPMGFNRGFYTVDLRFFYKITADAFIGCARPAEVTGLAVFDKRSILFGSEGTAKIFNSDLSYCNLDQHDLNQSNLPTAVIEAVDPILLNLKLVDVCTCPNPCCGSELCEIPAAILAAFDCDLFFGDDSAKRLYVTLGQFSILRLERDSQLLIPVYDYCLPEKECTSSGCENDPCELFQQVQFPVEDFFPPNSSSAIDPLRDLRRGGCCR